jgi:hypothetical protein
MDISRYRCCPAVRGKAYWANEGVPGAEGEEVVEQMWWSMSIPPV